ncbi:MAG: immune inhibitor A [Ignavibacteriae bacterium]|nr:immune inhibitor A [Ignavibacteriota bacterium]MCB9217781.1 immune inhibitor A [Ignavibacteria bacterium]
MMRFFALALVLPLFLFGSRLQAQPTIYVKAEIMPSRDSLSSAINFIQQLPSFDPHTLSITEGQTLTVILSRDDLDTLRNNGYNVNVVVENLQKFYARRAAEFELKKGESLNRSQSNSPDEFRTGSVAGFYSLEELEGELRRMKERYPALVSEVRSIGKSVEGRDIWGVRITAASDSVNTPAVLFTGLHHAREPMGMMAILYTMWHLLEQSESSPDINSLLRNRILWFVPCVNPDGYFYNITNYPEGGGLWRKNRGGTDSGGIDLNRNYGPEDNWRYPADGASNLPASGLYRGTAPFSEPEIRAIRDLVNGENIRLQLNHHSFGRLLIHLNRGLHPGLTDTAWHYLSARSLTRENGYAEGNPTITIGSNASGSSEGWMISGTSKDGLGRYSWAPEIGSEEDGFWPAPERILPLCQEILPAHITVARMAGSFCAITDRTIIREGGVSRLRLRVTNLGLIETPSEGTTITLNSVPQVQIELPPLAPGVSTTADIILPENMVLTGEARQDVVLEVKTRGLIHFDSTAMITHPTDILLADDFEGTLSLWNLDLWFTQNENGRGRALADSPYELYSLTGIPNVLELAAPISLVGYNAVDLSFQARGEVLGIGHALEIEVKREGEPSWQKIDGDFLQKPRQTSGEERSTIRGDHQSWQHYTIPLDDFAGKNIRLRMSMKTPPPGIRLEGVLIDDIAITAAADSPTSAEDGSEDETAPQQNIVFPTMFADVLAVRGDSEMRVQLFDLLGREVLSAVGSKLVQLPTSALPTGPYLLQVETDSKTLVRKVIRQ